MLGRPLEEVIDLLWAPEVMFSLLRSVRETYIQEKPRVYTIDPQALREGQDKGQFSYTIVPSHTSSGRVNGLIIYAADEAGQYKKATGEKAE